MFVSFGLNVSIHFYFKSHLSNLLASFPLEEGCESVSLVKNGPVVWVRCDKSIDFGGLNTVSRMFQQRNGGTIVYRTTDDG